MITQNIDRLHRKRGHASELIEVHGSIATLVVPGLRRPLPLDEVAALLDGDGVAACRDCMRRAAEARRRPVRRDCCPRTRCSARSRWPRGADLMLCVGSSLEVYPVAGLPELTLQAGGEVAIVTQGPTPLDAGAAVKLDGDVVAELEALLAAL